LRDRRIARHFLNRHIGDVSALVERIGQHYRNKITIQLTGTLTHRSDYFISEVIKEVKKTYRCDAEFGYVGRYITADDGTLPRIQHLVEGPRSLAPRKKPADMPKEEWLRALSLAPLRRVRWSLESAQTFHKLLLREGPEGFGPVQALLRDIAGLMISDDCDDRLVTRPLKYLHRTLVQYMAQDMGLHTRILGDGHVHQRVLITKRLGMLALPFLRPLDIKESVYAKYCS
jgi:hypothetical protein